MIEQTPKSLRLAIGIFGRMNVGKSSFLNYLCGQNVAVTSSIAGTTTDVVEKAVELLPLGPVLLLDTAGSDDVSSLSVKRRGKTESIFERAEIFVCVAEPDIWTQWEVQIEAEAKKRGRPLIIVINQSDKRSPQQDFLKNCNNRTPLVMSCSSINKSGREACVATFTSLCIKATNRKTESHIPLIGDLLPAGGVVVLVVPIDLQAPQGRLILPQVQTIRDALDNDAAAIIVKEREYSHVLKLINKPPDLVVCDSQAILKTVADTPVSVPCTTFSILFSRYKGDLNEQVKGCARIDSLKNGDKVLIAEACSHHALADDIGRVKIPRWLRSYTGADLRIDVSSGRDYPENLQEYSLVIHCGSCMLTRHEAMGRIERARNSGVPITNYGICIAMVQGVLKRALSPFPAALDAFENWSRGGSRTVPAINSPHYGA
jgi:[FeFe] hydrogenase H-cluster maturation GTPase HydF